MLNLPIQRGRQARAQRIVIYGPEGIGKSTLASHAPSPLFLDTEMGTGQLDVDRLDVTMLDHIGATVNALLNEQHEYKTVVVDTADNLWRLCADAVCAENKWTEIEKPGFGKGYAMASDKFRVVLSWFDRLIDRGVNVVIVSHAKVDRVNPPDNAEYSKYCIKVCAPTKQAEASREFLKEWCDCLLFCNFDMTVSSTGKAIGNHERVVNTVPAPAWEAKNRYGLPEAMPMTAETMQAIFQAAQGGAQQPAQAPAPAQVEKVPAQAPAPTLPKGYEQAVKREREVLTAFFVGTGKLQPGQTLEDLPANIAAALKARPQQALDRALAWCEQNGKEKKC
ncbi:ATP-binding protein [Fibrobacter sp.]|uniref:ATP-binding protein n=1 Tax=Fibrobacter sp. TaxID=35828 RepID=UPI0025C3D0B5|nr:ATP-binding protein [Fibrobacter sp.]MBR4008174.1 ATP-binding protein [Fibrobacter sp.]